MRKTKQDLKKIALERIKTLFKEADLAYKKDPKLSNRYVQIARKLAMKLNLKLPSNLKRKFCKHCYSFLKPGSNCRVRTKNKQIIYYCQNCKKYNKFNFSK
jgi:ribonuclease P protein subunit RPR2